MEKVVGGYSEINRKRWLTVISPVGMILTWEVIVRLGLVNAEFIPAPSTIARAAFQAIQNGQLWGDLQISLFRI